MNAAPLANVEPYLQPWSGTAVTNLTGTPSLVTITVSGPCASGLSAAQTKPAVQELAWTAQAALGHGAVPVKFVLANGPPMLFGTYPTAQAYNSPARTCSTRGSHRSGSRPLCGTRFSRRVLSPIPAMQRWWPRASPAPSRAPRGGS